MLSILHTLSQSPHPVGLGLQPLILPIKLLRPEERSPLGMVREQMCNSPGKGTQICGPRDTGISGLVPGVYETELAQKQASEECPAPTGPSGLNQVSAATFPTPPSSPGLWAPMVSHQGPPGFLQVPRSLTGNGHPPNEASMPFWKP